MRPKPDPLTTTLTVLAVARITHLVTTDVILDRPRDWLTARLPAKTAYGLSCPWCVSTHVGLAVAPVVWRWHHRPAVQITVLALAASYLTGLVEQASTLANAANERAEGD